MDASPRASVRARLAAFGPRRLALVLALVLSQVFLVVIPSQASAAAAFWTQTPTKCGGLAEERDSGQMDANGNLYVACSKADSGALDPSIRIYNTAGTLVRIVAVGQKPGDVAPSADGKILFVLNFVTKVTERWDWSPTAIDRDNRAGAYVKNAGWSAAAVPGLGAPRGEFIATDAQGGLYISSGLWVPGAPDTIAKYDFNGAFVTNFGSIAKSWSLGVGYDEFTGLAVTANGGRVFVAEKLNSRVQRWDKQASGAYVAKVAFGNSEATDPTRQGQCNQDGLLAAPYDVALTPGGEVVVMSTTCFYTDAKLAATLGVPVGTFEVQRFRQDGTSLGTVRGVATTGVKVHGIAVDRQGSIYALEGGIVLRRPAGLSEAGNDSGGGGPMGGTAVAGGGGNGDVAGVADVTAPVINSIQASVTRGSKDVTMVIGATDDRAVVNARITEEGAPFPVRALTNPFVHTVADYGTRTLAVVVVDAAGNVSSPYYVRATTVAAPPVVPAPTPAAPTPAKPVMPPLVGGAKPTTPKPATPTPQAPNAVVDTVAPTILKVAMPGQVVRGRKLSVTLKATDNVRGTLQVRFATENGRWGAWQSVTGRKAITLSAGRGWKGMFTQVRDAAGNRSKPWFQTVFAAPVGASWARGTAGVDRIAGTRRSDYVDASQYDSKVDSITCGGGTDYVLLQPGDVAARDCEHVARVITPKF